MKKMMALLLAVLTLVTLAACTKSNPGINEGISQVDPWSIEGTGEAGAIEVSSEKTAYNPLTGISNMAQDRVGMRPIAVSVNNIVFSLPQYGISEADYILEMETEGGITRLMCLFADIREVSNIGSLRSLRDQFIEALYPLDPIIVHYGTSIYADRVITQYNFPTLDAMIVTPAQWTDSDRAQTYQREHTKFTGGAAIADGIELANINTETTSKATAFNFIGENDEKIVPGSGVANTVNYDFSPGYDGDFRYDEATGMYLKWQHGEPHIDAGAGDKQLAFDNVILLFTEIELYPNQKELLVDVTFDKGKGYYFSQGHYEEITWEKGEYPSNFVFTKVSDDTELQVNVGKTHMGIIRTDYENSLKIG